jgi:hypothetical protein
MIFRSSSASAQRPARFNPRPWAERRARIEARLRRTLIAARRFTLDDTIRNSHRARKRGWITNSISAAEFERERQCAGAHPYVSLANLKTMSERTDAERLRDEGKHVASIGWAIQRGQAHRTRGQPGAFERGLKSCGDSADFRRSTMCVVAVSFASPCSAMSLSKVTSPAPPARLAADCKRRRADIGQDQRALS